MLPDSSLYNLAAEKNTDLVKNSVPFADSFKNVF